MRAAVIAAVFLAGFIGGQITQAQPSSLRTTAESADGTRLRNGSAPYVVRMSLVSGRVGIALEKEFGVAGEKPAGF